MMLFPLSIMLWNAAALLPVYYVIKCWDVIDLVYHVINWVDDTASVYYVIDWEETYLPFYIM